MREFNFLLFINFSNIHKFAASQSQSSNKEKLKASNTAGVHL